jgi:hypothetical protein
MPLSRSSWAVDNKSTMPIGGGLEDYFVAGVGNVFGERRTSMAATARAAGALDPFRAVVSDEGA